uniref:Uncharacterized protein n=1 Tax=Cucumis melo TaxID=3656 RepID=A0A9I9CJ79_CUCME
MAAAVRVKTQTYAGPETNILAAMGTDPIKQSSNRTPNQQATVKEEPPFLLNGTQRVLVALYEQNDKPSSALEFIQQRLGGPSKAEYEKLQSEMADLQVKYDELLATHKETCKESPVFRMEPVEGSDQVWLSEVLLEYPPGCRLSKNGLEELKSSHNITVTSTKDTTDDEDENDKL